MSVIDDLLAKFMATSKERGDVDNITSGISIGIVVDNDDPLEQGRLRIFCPAYNDDPKKLLHTPWAAYVSPVGGVIDQTAYVRGTDPENANTTGPVHYGIWAIPEIGAHALVACINGDVRRRVWLGCLPSHQETHTIGNGRFKHSGNNVDGPLSSTRNPIQPTYSKLQEAFNDDISSSEWKSRGADYQFTAVRDRPSPDKSVYLDSSNDDMVASEEDSWVKDILGDHGYDWTSYKNLGSFLASKVQGWSTPGFHSFTMDDRAFNCRIRIRTASGSQIILDDTNERMYFSVSGGKTWLELDASGNVDLYAERRLSIHSKKDLNLSSDESIRMKAGTFISMYAGETSDQTPLTEPLNVGEIRLHAGDDMHVYSNGKLKVSSDDNMYLGANGPVTLFGTDVEFNVSGKDTTVNDLTSHLDSFVSVYNGHSHVNAGANLNPSPALPISTVDTEIALIAPWTNRVPDHEPWPRVLMQDGDDAVNVENDGYLNNVDWVPQYDNVTTPDGREPIGKVEGDETIVRGPFWRR